MNALSTCIHALRKAMSAIVILLFSLMMIAVLVQVGGRYVFNYSIAGAAEIATFSQIWLVMLGSGIAMARHQHVAIDFLPAQLPLPLARAASILIVLVTIGFLCVLAYGSVPLLRLGIMQTSSAMQLPMWVMYLCLPVGAAYVALELVVSIVERWDDPFAANQSDFEEEAA
ncbi:TRAP transporter small permease [Aquamicrobium sp. LC103]|nr:TRAP transporter small permease [Aquamicrobium sp. LC103]